MTLTGKFALGLLLLIGLTGGAFLAWSLIAPSTSTPQAVAQETKQTAVEVQNDWEKLNNVVKAQFEKTRSLKDLVTSTADKPAALSKVKSVLAEVAVAFDEVAARKATIEAELQRKVGTLQSLPEDTTVRIVALREKKSQLAAEPSPLGLKAPNYTSL